MRTFTGCAFGETPNENRGTRLPRALQLLLCALGGSAIGCVLATGFDYGMHWHVHGSADPRCVLRWSGYVEVHSSTSRNVERITCEYRPELGERWPKKS